VTPCTACGHTHERECHEMTGHLECICRAPQNNPPFYPTTEEEK